MGLKTINNRMYYFPQVQGSEGRAGMAAIVDHDGSLNLAKLADGLKKELPSYARPLFIRIVRNVDTTGKQLTPVFMGLIIYSGLCKINHKGLSKL